MSKRNITEDDDNVFRLIGGSRPKTSHASKRPIWGAIAIGSILIAICIAIAALQEEKTADEEPGLFESQSQSPNGARAFLGQNTDDTTAAYAETIDTVVSQTELTIYIPHNLTPALSVGAPDDETRKAIMAFQAADIRADNLQILGSFILNGKVLAQGTSKTGFCAIIDGELSVGVADDTQLFDRAKEQNGFFFRQYPLVDNGVAVHNNLTSQTTRKALCDRAGQSFVVATKCDMSLNDFSKVLVALGVDNAIYLVGSTAYGWYVDKNGERTGVGLEQHKYDNESYIVWWPTSTYAK